MSTVSIDTSNRWDTRTLVTMALLAAIGAALSFIEFPFGVQFLKYDASNIPALVGGFVLGPLPGFIVGLISCLIHAIFTGDWLGGIMNIAAVAASVLPAAVLYRKMRSIKGGIVGLVIGMVSATAVMVLLNVLLDPPFYGYELSMVIGLIMPVLVPFNLMKTGINAVLCILVYKPISNVVRPRKAGVVMDDDEDED